jgi:hypothetical protein
MDETVQQGEHKSTRQRKGVAAFDMILAALSDAEDVARKLLEAQKVGVSTRQMIKAKSSMVDYGFRKLSKAWRKRPSFLARVHNLSTSFTTHRTGSHAHCRTH